MAQRLPIRGGFGAGEACRGRRPRRPFSQNKKNKEMYTPFGIHISLLFFILLYFSAFFRLPMVAVAVTAAADRVNRAAHRAKLLSSPVGTFVRMGISAFSV